MMRRLARMAAVAALTFSVGVAAVTLYLWQRAPVAEIPPVSPVDMTPQPTCFPGLSLRADAPRGSSPYFPAGVFDHNPSRERFIVEWYAKHLKAMGEPSLLGGRAGGGEAYRFLWLRSFHHPVAVRVWSADGEYFLAVKESSGAGGYEPGALIVNSERRLSGDEWEGFIRLLDQACYWNLPAEKDLQGFDGAQWILEGFKEGRYYLAERWSPRDGAYREACLYLLKPSGLKIDPGSDEVY